MSRIETLLPYLKEKKENEPTVIADSREAGSAPKVIKGLAELGAQVKIDVLQKGDYIISDRCAIERKTVTDFVHTLTRRFLFEQLFTLKEAYLQPLVLIEGYMPIIYKYSKISPFAVWGAMFALAKQGISIVHTMNSKETADFIYTAAKQEQIVEKRVPMIRPLKKTETLAESQLFFVAGLPNIGREKADALLRTYETPIGALSKVDCWADDVAGLGPKITEKVKQVLCTPYKA
ncbi:MAG TPA: ERCC4 domain-containing protein [archaeon]|nr:ERCC4 domain-containing protein [archaeon]